MLFAVVSCEGYKNISEAPVAKFDSNETGLKAPVAEFISNKTGLEVPGAKCEGIFNLFLSPIVT